MKQETYHPPMPLGQLVRMLQGILERGADPELPLGIWIGKHQAFVNTIAVSDQDDCEIWLGE